MTGTIARGNHDDYDFILGEDGAAGCEGQVLKMELDFSLAADGVDR